MLPLNKPIINSSSSKKSYKEFVKIHFPNYNSLITFSTRQALHKIYSQIQEDKGPQIVATSPLTCIEAILPILQSGHEIKFIDIDPETFNMNESLIPSNMKIIQAIHFGGNPQDMKIINTKKPKILIEDCAQGFGSYYSNKHIGLFGNYSAFSFMKNFYSLGGGLLLSNSNNIFNGNYTSGLNYLSTIYRYIKRSLEKKCKTEFTFSFGLLKLIVSLKTENAKSIVRNLKPNKHILKSIENQLHISNIIIQKRQHIASLILNNINNDKMFPQKITKLATSNYLRLLFRLEKGSSKEAISYFRKKGIGANHLTQNFFDPYQERFDKIHLIKNYINKSQLNNYFELHDRIISVPVSPALTKSEALYIADIINQY